MMILLHQIKDERQTEGTMMILLQPNQEGEGQGKKCHARTMMYDM
jgi:hypothetical protein